MTHNRTRKKKCTAILEEDETAYPVTFSLQLEFELLPPPEPARESRSKESTSEQPKSQFPKNVSKYIHFEFKPPQDDKPLKADIVVHSMKQARIFNGAEINSVRSRIDDEFDSKVWFWHKYSFDMAVNNQLLDTLYDQPIALKVWDSKDKVSSRARFDRPKITSLSGRSQRDSTLTSQKALSSSSLQQKKGKKISDKAKRKSKTMLKGKVSTVEVMQEDLRAKAASDSAHAVLRKLLAAPKTNVTDDGGAVINLDLRKFFMGETTITKEIKFNQATTWLEHISSVKVTLTLDRPLLSPLQQRRLNPLEITIKSAHNLPSTPVGFTELATTCYPPYVKMGFLNTDPVKLCCDESANKSKTKSENKTENNNNTRGIKQDWEKSVIVLTSRFNPEELERYCRFETLSVEVHDRQRKLRHRPSADKMFTTNNTHALFSDFDEAVGVSVPDEVDWVTGAEEEEEEEEEEEAMSYDPYGVASIQLADILTGTRLLRMECPILPCKNAGAHTTPPTLVDGQPAPKPMHAGHYVQAGSFLDVTVELVVPYRRNPNGGSTTTTTTKATTTTMTPTTTTTTTATSPQYTFLQAVFVANIGAAASTVVSAITRRFREAAAAAGLVVASDITSADESLDVLTGIHLVCTEYHILIVEGLLSSKHLHHVFEDAVDFDAKYVKSIFNSKIPQQHRLYADFGTQLKTVVIPEPINELLNKVELYVRNSRGWECRSGLMKLQELREGPSMQGIYERKLLPSPTTVCAIDNVYGVDNINVEQLTQELSDLGSANNQQQLQSSSPTLLSSRMRAATATMEPVSKTVNINNTTNTTNTTTNNNNTNNTNNTTSTTSTTNTTNKPFETVLISRARSAPINFVEKNVQVATTMTPPYLGEMDEVIFADGNGGPVVMYASQRLNSVNITRCRMQHELFSPTAKKKSVYTTTTAGNFAHTAFTAQDEEDPVGDQILHRNTDHSFKQGDFDTTSKMVALNINRTSLDTSPSAKKHSLWDEITQRRQSAFKS